MESNAARRNSGEGKGEVVMRKFFLLGLVWLGSVLPCAAVPLAACNGTLTADYIRSGGGNYGSIDCDAQGQLVLKGKTYQVFEYSAAGYGQVSLGVMEPGFAPETANFDHVLDVSLEGLENGSHAGSLADNNRFKITFAKGGGEGSPKITVLSEQIEGKCARQYNDKGEQISADLENCQGTDWRLKIFPKPRGE